MSAKEINASMSVQEIKDSLREHETFLKSLPAKGAETTACKREIATLKAALTARAGKRIGRTGPRYSEEQLEQVAELRGSGASWKVVGKATGIRATAYLAKNYADIVGSDDPGAKTKPAVKKPAVKKTATKPAAKKGATKTAAKPAGKRTVRVPRVSKAVAA